MVDAVHEYQIRPVTAEHWEDFERLFGSSGAYSGCWCMWWRLKSSEFNENKNQGNRAAMQAIVAEGRVPGLLAYDGEEPVGWLSLGPRPEFGRIERSPLFKAVDDTPVWSIVCFFIHKQHRRQGVASALLEGAIDYARTQGASALEAYPIDLAQAGKSYQGEANIYTGTTVLFERAGFEVVRRTKPARPVMRFKLS